jgi:hypothetical protein
MTKKIVSMPLTDTARKRLAEAPRAHGLNGNEREMLREILTYLQLLSPDRRKYVLAFAKQLLKRRRLRQGCGVVDLE